MSGFSEERVNEVFNNFHERYNDSDIDILCSAFKNLSQEKSIALKALSIKSANCLDSVSFSRASVLVDEHLEKWYPFGIVFLTGLRILRNFLQDGAVPQVDKERDILSSLLTYLLDKEISTALCHASDYKLESNLTLLMLNHLLLRVTPHKNCSLDMTTSWIFKCPDECKNGFKSVNLKTSDTSIGHQEVWHGNLNALMGRSSVGDLAVTTLNPDYDKGDSDSHGLLSNAEMKQDPVNADKPHQRILSETIVYSLLQKRLHPTGNSLIPTIGISGTELVVYFYDNEKDVLLQSRGIPFKEKGEMQITAVLVAWLVANYKYLCDGLTESLNDAPKANFFSHCKDKEDIYKSRVRHGGVGNGVRYSFDQWKYDCSTFETPQCLADLTDIVPMKKQRTK